MFDSLTHQQRAFLTAYIETAKIGLAAEAAGVHRSSHHNWLRDAEYAAAFELADRMAGDLAEDEAKRRGVDGVEELVVYKGEPVLIDGKRLTKRKYSDRLLLAILAGAKPEKYATKKVDHEHTGKVEHAHRVDLSSLSDEELHLLERLASKTRTTELRSDDASPSQLAELEPDARPGDDPQGDRETEGTED